MYNKIKEIIKNLALSFFSYALPTAVLQFVVQPLLAGYLGSELNGQYLTLMSLNYFTIGVTAGVLNTVRMLRNEEYEKAGVRGDFNVFMLIYAAIVIVVMPVGFLFYTDSRDILDILLFVLIGFLYLYHDYIFCQYRLKFQYNKILINNIILVVGYMVGLFLFRYIPKWQIVIIVAYGLGAIYDFFNTDFIREPARITPLFKDTRNKLLALTGSSALGSTITYFDKLLLYPLLGGTLVSVYNTATMVGKMLILISSPLTSVFLSYLVKMDTLRIKINFKWIMAFVGGLLVAYGACLAVGYPLTGFLYPGWAEQSQQYIPITVLSSLLTFVATLLNTVVVRFCKAYWQIIIQGFNLVLYLVLSLSFMKIWSLWGFCVGVTVSGIIKVIMLVFIIIRYANTEVDKHECI